MSDLTPTATAPDEFSSYEGFSDGTEVDDEVAEDETSEAPETDTADAGEPEVLADEELDTSDEQTFTVKVDGEDIQVPLSELLAGYSRTSDYTRKTQALADQRRTLSDAEALVAALERDPRTTLAALAQAYELVPAEGTDEEYLTPEQQEIRQLRAWQQEQMAAQREAQIDAQIGALHTQYGDFDEGELFSFAVARDVRDLETALKALQWEKAVEAARSRQTPAPKIAEKRKAAAMTGGTPRSSVAAPVEDMEVRSFRDAYEYAKRVLNS